MVSYRDRVHASGALTTGMWWDLLPLLLYGQLILSLLLGQPSQPNTLLSLAGPWRPDTLILRAGGGEQWRGTPMSPGDQDCLQKRHDMFLKNTTIPDQRDSLEELDYSS